MVTTRALPALHKDSTTGAKRPEIAHALKADRRRSTDSINCGDTHNHNGLYVRQRRRRSKARGVSVSGKCDEEKIINHPIGLPESIPAEAAQLYFNATPAVQRQLIMDASETDFIRSYTRPVLESTRRFKTEVAPCFCQDMQMCPLVAASASLHGERSCDGLTYQYYPSDEGWWKMRDLVLQLGAISSKE